MKKFWLEVIQGLWSFHKTRITPANSYQSLIRLFCLTHGKSNDILHKFVTYFRPKKKFSHNSLFQTSSKDNVKKIVQNLNSDGYHILNEKLSLEIVESLKGYALKNLMEPEYSYETPEEIKVKKIIFDPKNLKAIRYHFTEDQIINFPEVQKLFTDTFLLSIAQEYFNCLPLADVCAFWWLTDYSKESDVQAATMWHFDMDRIKWLKVFIYLTDVTSETGPHMFVKGSHLSGNIPKEILNKGYARLTDEEINKHYPSEQVMEFTAPAGTIIIEDTRGLHKGKPAIKGSRLILQLQFSDYGYGGTLTKSKFNKFNDEFTEKFIKNNKKIYERFL
ncbi:MAG: phytanoyl-CoA dioxygenase family protein [Leptospiraceae bacterium]|nr:phytanoyl-CoA dioxygenase family protein [Leptospiraceae bacterium]